MYNIYYIYTYNTLNIKNTTRHHGRKPAPLIYFLRSLQGQFCGTQFLISFLKLFREMNSFIFTGAISQFLEISYEVLSEP